MTRWRRTARAAQIGTLTGAALMAAVLAAYAQHPRPVWVWAAALLAVWTGACAAVWEAAAALRREIAASQRAVGR